MKIVKLEREGERERERERERYFVPEFSIVRGSSLGAMASAVHQSKWL